MNWYTVFPRIVSAETVLFWTLPYVLWPLMTVHKSAETIQGRKLFKGGNYSRKYGRRNQIQVMICDHDTHCPRFSKKLFLKILSQSHTSVILYKTFMKTNSVQCRGTGTVQSTAFTENMAGKTGRIFVAKPEILGDVYIAL